MVDFMVENAMETMVERVRARLALPDPERRRAIREAAGVSRDEMGHAVGCTGAAVRLWEDGTRTPRGERLVAYVDLLTSLEAELSSAVRDEAT